MSRREFDATRETLATVPVVAEYLAVSRSKVYTLMDGGELVYVKLNRSRRIPWQAVDDLIRRNTVGDD